MNIIITLFAMINIKQCYKINYQLLSNTPNNSSPTEPPTNAPNNILYILIGLVSAIILLLLFIVGGILYCRTKTPMVEYNDDL